MAVTTTEISERGPRMGTSTAERPSPKARFPIVESKLVPPASRPEMVLRRRLLNELDASVAAVVAVIAPPGYGKTVLLSQWVAGGRRPVGWLTLDASDNDPSMLVSYLAAAFGRVQHHSRSTALAVSDLGERSLATAVPGLIAELNGWPQPGLIVIDDVHRLTSRDALGVLAALIDHLPAGFRICLLGRQYPELPLAAWRASRDLLEVGAPQLALDRAETAALTSAAGCSLGPEAIRQLHRRTEGWAVGIYLATLGLKPSQSGPTPYAHLPGSDRGMADYLRSEFEAELEPDDMTFLTRSVVLDLVTPEVAEAVSGLPDAAQRLRRLSRYSLLIQELPRPELTYRYHNLLRDYLSAELMVLEPTRVPHLHRRAADWFDGHGRSDMAIDHLLAANDLDAAAELICRAPLPFQSQGHLSTLERWLPKLEPRTLREHPSLALAAAWLYLLTGRGDEADAMADIADQVGEADEKRAFAAQRLLLRAVMTRSGPRQALADAQLAASLDPAGDGWRSASLFVVGSLHELVGDAAAADAFYERAITAGPADGQTTAIAALAKRARLRIEASDWTAAEEYIAQADELHDRWQKSKTIPILLVHAIAARVALNRGDLEAGRRSLVRAQLLRPLANHAAPWLSVDGLLSLSRAYLAVSDPAGAQIAVREAEHIVRRRPALGGLTTELVAVRERLSSASATLIGSSTLTAAELRVLPFLPTYLSFQEIAERLSLSRNTVKTHAMSIYGKLWASSRGEAVERAVEMGLLEQYPALVRPNGGSKAFNSAAADMEQDLVGQ